MVPSSRRSIDTAGLPNEIARSGCASPSARFGASLRSGPVMLSLALMSGGLHLCGLAVEECADPIFCFIVGRGARYHQRLHQETGLRIAFRDHLQRLQPCEIG